MNTHTIAQEIKTAKVKAANKEFYNIVSQNYEALDGKRDATTTAWITDKLEQISACIPQGNLLDIGCGSGFILRNISRSVPKNILLAVGVDISYEILLPLKKQGYQVVCADVDHLPFKDNGFSLVTCFAVLHHLYTHEKILEEAYRVLKKNGVLYTDHDIDIHFSKKFSFPLGVYRFFCNEKKKYTRSEKKITAELYHLTEIHNNGIPSDEIITLARTKGFEVFGSYHWLGLFPWLTRFLWKNKITFTKGNAPLVSCFARKLERKSEK